MCADALKRLWQVHMRILDPAHGQGGLRAPGSFPALYFSFAFAPTQGRRQEGQGWRQRLSQLSPQMGMVAPIGTVRTGSPTDCGLCGVWGSPCWPQTCLYAESGDSCHGWLEGLCPELRAHGILGGQQEGVARLKVPRLPVRGTRSLGVHRFSPPQPSCPPAGRSLLIWFQNE